MSDSIPNLNDEATSSSISTATEVEVANTNSNTINSSTNGDPTRDTSAAQNTSSNELSNEQIKAGMYVSDTTAVSQSGVEIDENSTNLSKEGGTESAGLKLNANEDAATDEVQPSIKSYFGGDCDNDDPFGSINVPVTTSGGNTDLIQDEQSDSKDNFSPSYADADRQFSPPVTKNEINTDDLVSLHTTELDLSGSNLVEINRLHDAWIPNESTRRLLVQAVTTDGPFHLLPDQILKPHLLMADTQADPIFQEVYKLRGESETYKRQVLNLSKVEHNMIGLNQLIRAESWRSALDLTAILLTNMGQGLQPQTSASSVITELSMKTWACRIALLYKLRFYSIAEAECQQFSQFDSPELHFEFHKGKYPGRTGSMVPFSLRILYACLPQFLGRHNESLDRLFHIKGQVNKILHNLQNGMCEDGSAIVISDASRKLSTTLWHQRELQVLYNLAGCLAEMKDFRLAIDAYKEILSRDPDKICYTYSTMGRLCLQMGAIQAGQSYFNLSVKSCQDEELRKVLTSLHSGYMAVCQGEYPKASEFFHSTSSCPSMHVLGKNNAAISMLYNGQLKSGIVLLEELIKSDPEKYLQESIALNLCTLYELESSVAISKKHQVLFLANQHKGNGFNINSLKITLT